MNEDSDIATESNFQSKSSIQNLNCPLRKTNYDQYALSYIGPTFWNQTPHILKRCNDLNTVKHNFKKYFIKKLKNSNNSF